MLMPLPELMDYFLKKNPDATIKDWIKLLKEL
jgi:hypothetical protein